MTNDPNDHANSLLGTPSTSEIIAPQILNTSFVSLIDFSQITFYDANESLKDYLSHDFDGINILCNFEQNPKKTLSDDMRSLLVKKVIDRDVNCALRDANFQVGKKPLEKFVINRTRFQELADEIQAEFNEKSELYYTPFYHENDIKINPSGKLWERYNTIKKIMRDAGVLKSKPKVVEKSQSVTDETILEKIQNLKNNTVSIDQVKQYWSETFDERHKNLSHKKKTNDSSHLTYECLRTEIGIDLINFDFKKIQPKVSDDCIKKNWPSIRELIKNYYKDNPKLVPNEIASKLLLLLNVSEDESEIILLLLLSCILDNTSVKSDTPKKAGKKRKNLCGESPPSKSTKESEDLSQLELTNDFLSIVKIETQVNELINQKKTVALAEKKTVQPYMLFVGTPEKCSSFYVVVDDYKYKLTDALTALQLNLKIFFVWDLKFPQSCQNTWIFIQKSVFDIPSIGNKYPARVNKMLGYLEHSVKSQNPIAADNICCIADV